MTGQNSHYESENERKPESSVKTRTKRYPKISVKYIYMPATRGRLQQAFDQSPVLKPESSVKTRTKRYSKISVKNLEQKIGKTKLYRYGIPN